MTSYAEFHRRSIEDRDAFWAEQARLIDWQTPPATHTRRRPNRLVVRSHSAPNTGRATSAFRATPSRAAASLDFGRALESRARNEDATDDDIAVMARIVQEAIEAGALGFVVKDAPAAQLADAVRRTARGERHNDRDGFRRIALRRGGAGSGAIQR